MRPAGTRPVAGVSIFATLPGKSHRTNASKGAVYNVSASPRIRTCTCDWRASGIAARVTLGAARSRPSSLARAAVLSVQPRNTASSILTRVRVTLLRGHALNTGGIGPARSCADSCASTPDRSEASVATNDARSALLAAILHVSAHEKHRILPVLLWAVYVPVRRGNECVAHVGVLATDFAPRQARHGAKNTLCLR